MADSLNIGDDGEDEVLHSSMFDQTNWQASNNHGAGYSKPSVAQQPALHQTRQNLPNTPSAREVESLVNGLARDWGLENLDKPLVFPLRPNNQLSDLAKPQPSPLQPPLSVSVASINAISPNTGGSTQYASPTAYYQPTPSYTSQASRLVFEEVFQYPSKNTDGLSNPHYGDVSSTVGVLGFSRGYASTVEDPSFPSYPSNVGAQPAYPSNMASPSRFSQGDNLDFSRTRYQPSEIFSPWLPREPVLSTQEVEVSQKVSEPILPPPPSSYIIQSTNGYKRGRYLVTKSRYTPEFPFPMAVSSKGVKGPSQAAASKGVKNPERYVCYFKLLIACCEHFSLKQSLFSYRPKW